VFTPNNYNHYQVCSIFAGRAIFQILAAKCRTSRIFPKRKVISNTYIVTWQNFKHTHEG